MFRSSRWLAGAALLAVAGLGSAAEPGKKVGPAALKSAGAMAFGPDGVLFVADTAGRMVYALDTGDSKAGNSVPKVEKLDEQIASALGIAADQLLINDLKVNPATGRVFLSAARGKGPDAAPVIVKIGDDGKPAELDLKKIGYSSVTNRRSDRQEDVVRHRHGVREGEFGSLRRHQSRVGLQPANHPVPVHGREQGGRRGNLPRRPRQV